MSSEVRDGLTDWFRERQTHEQIVDRALAGLRKDLLEIFEREIAPPADAAMVDVEGLRYAIRCAIGRAFVAGAEAVHEEWGRGEERPNGDPEFGEAGSDYAAYTDFTDIDAALAQSGRKSGE